MPSRARTKFFGLRDRICMIHDPVADVSLLRSPNCFQDLRVMVRSPHFVDRTTTLVSRFLLASHFVASCCHLAATLLRIPRLYRGMHSYASIKVTAIVILMKVLIV